MNWDRIEQDVPQNKMIIINNPHNPLENLFKTSDFTAHDLMDKFPNILLSDEYTTLFSKAHFSTQQKKSDSTDALLFLHLENHFILAGRLDT
jgi:bifunctional pyridoxal-dependent enzyme with beta-cystathionase and maltose regulon repressor activities